jgi:hypothetical protein
LAPRHDCWPGGLIRMNERSAYPFRQFGPGDAAANRTHPTLRGAGSKSASNAFNPGLKPNPALSCSSSKRGLAVVLSAYLKYESRRSHRACLASASVRTWKVVQPELGTQRCSLARPSARRSVSNGAETGYPPHRYCARGRLPRFRTGIPWPRTGAGESLCRAMRPLLFPGSLNDPSSRLQRFRR